jgi:hypothetical protein
LWVTDISYILTWAGILYLAVVLDAFSRKILSWPMATHLRTEPVLAARNMARTTAAGGSHSLLRSRKPIHRVRLRQTPRRSLNAAFDGLGRRLSRQCHRRELFSPPSNASCSTAPPSKPKPRRAGRSLSLLKGGTILIAATPRSTISHRSLTNEHTLHNPLMV